MPAVPQPRLLHITTIPLTLMFLRGQLGFVRRQGFEIELVSSPGPELERFAANEGLAAHAVAMERRIAPHRDLVSLVRLWWLLRRRRPAIVHAHTPKAGLLGMLAAFLARVPVRIYHLRGLPLETATGWRRRLLRHTEWLACGFAQRVIAVGPSLRATALAAGLCPPDKIVVIAGGSGNGVDAAERFNPARQPAASRADRRREAGIPDEARVVGFVGRLVRDKGVAELATAWAALRQRFADLHLLLVGPEEREDAVPAAVLAALRSDERVHFAGLAAETAVWYPAMDVVTLPTHREGFPNVPLEAAAMGLPVVATAIPGCRDAVADGETGTLVPAGDATALAGALASYLADPALAHRHGQAGRARVLASFRQEVIWAGIAATYWELLARHGRRPAWLGKRACDAVAAFAGLVVLSPVLLATAAAVALLLGRPVLFRQPRPGRGGRPFTLVKFRSMSEQRDAAGRLLPDAERLGRCGRLLRATSLDELPTLWNVLRGEMSLVGPRPLLVQYLERYTAEQARRHEVRPGITGWAQVNGRNAIDWETKLALDVWYVDHQSLGLDLRILAKTLVQVVRAVGIRHGGEATMPEFMGSQSATAQPAGADEPPRQGGGDV